MVVVDVVERCVRIIENCVRTASDQYFANAYICVCCFHFAVLLGHAYRAFCIVFRSYIALRSTNRIAKFDPVRVSYYLLRPRDGNTAMTFAHSTRVEFDGLKNRFKNSETRISDIIVNA